MTGFGARKGCFVYKVLNVHLRMVSAVLLMILLIKPGSAFKLYDIFNQKKDTKYNQRTVELDPDSPVLVTTLQCLDTKCPHLELHQMLQDPTTIENCISQCVPESAVSRRTHENSGRNVIGLRSREVDPLASCIEAKCIGRPYPVCVYEQCMAQLRLGKFFRRENDVSEDDDDDASLLPDEEWSVMKRARPLGRRQLEKRVGEACATCFPKSDHFPGCRMICA